MQYDVWYERGNAKVFLRSNAVDLLLKHKFGVYFASNKGNLNVFLAKVIRKLNQSGIPFAYWHFLSVKLGYWINNYNAKVFSQEIDDVLEWASYFDVRIDEFIIDMQPPIWLLSAIKESPFEFLGKLRMFYEKGKRIYDKGLSVFGEVRDKIKSYGARVIVTIMDIFFDMPRNAVDRLKIIFGTPFDEIDSDTFLLTIHNSTLAENTKIPLPILRARMFKILQDAKRKFGEKVGVSLGLTWSWRYSEEPIYEDPHEIGKDASIAKAAGVKKIAINKLEGVIFRNNDERWFNEVVSAKPTTPGVIDIIGALAFRSAFLFLSSLIRIATV